MKKKQKILCLFLSVCMVFTCMIGLSATASAGGSVYTFNATADNWVPSGDWNYAFNLTPAQLSKVTKIEVLIYMESIAETGWGQVTYSRGASGAADRVEHAANLENTPSIKKYTAGEGVIENADWAGVQLVGKGKLLAYTITFSEGDPVSAGDWRYPEITFPTGLTATVGQTLADVALPTATNGTWSWSTSSTSVGEAGEKTFPAKFNPSDPSLNTVLGINVPVTVSEASTTAVSEVSLEHKGGIVALGGAVPINATIAPDDATDKTVKWSVGGDPGVLELYEDSDCTKPVGSDATAALTVYAKSTAIGDATVTVTSNSDPNKSASCIVLVTYKAYPTGGSHAHLDLIGEDADQYADGLKNPLRLGVLLSRFSDEVTVVIVPDEGYIFPETSEYYTTTNGVTLARVSDTQLTVTGAPTADTLFTVPYTVKIDPNTIAINYGNVDMKVGERYPLAIVHLNPSDPEVISPRYESSDPTTVSVDDSGMFEALRVGTATLTVTETYGTEDTSDDAVAQCFVTVKAEEPVITPRTYTPGNISGYLPNNIPTTTTAATTNTTTTVASPAAQADKTGTFEDITDWTANAGGAHITTPLDDLADAVLTSEDRAAMAKGSDVKVYLKVTDVTPTEAELELAEGILPDEGEEPNAAFINVELFKQVGSGSPVQITKTNGEIEIGIFLPDDMKNTDPNVERKYYVIRFHDGKAEIIPCKYDPEKGMITFTTDEFSLYAVAFIDLAFDEPVDDVLDTGVELSEESGHDLFDAVVNVDTAAKTVTVELNGETVPAGEYKLIYFTYTPIEGGESLERVGTEFPTAAGTYIATVTANDGSEYINAARSDPFTVSGEVASAGETNPHTGSPLAGMGTFAALSFFAAAAAYTIKKRHK